MRRPKQPVARYRFSFLPVLGIWMLPLGLLLIACDVPFLRKPVGHFTISAVRKWTALRQYAARYQSDDPKRKRQSAPAEERFESP
jgi:hypothetical protein